MTNSRPRKAPPVLLGLVVFCALLIHHGRWPFADEGPPAFSFAEHDGSCVEFGAGFANPGVHQFSDGQSLMGVIELTQGLLTNEVPLQSGCPETPLNGLLLKLEINEKKETQIQCNWMPASHRMALGVALHPERMSIEDWQALPGIGEAMANRIEIDRQSFGDFGSLEALERVRGVGKKRIEAWKEFF